MSRGMPSMIALLGLLAVAGYQNRDKIAEVLGGLKQEPGGGPDQNNQQGGQGGMLGNLGGLLGGASAGSVLSGGLGRPDRALQAERPRPGGGFLGQDRSQSTARPGSARASDRPRCAEHAFAANRALAGRVAVQADTGITRSGGQIYAGGPAADRRRGGAADLTSLRVSVGGARWTQPAGVRFAAKRVTA